MNKLVSIIVPVFNTDLYLDKCITSIIEQTFYNLEIILVNDGSTDSSKNIIDNYSTQERRIVAIHKENGGIGSAYKTAFRVMTGDYLLFVDSDDWLELDAVENLVKLAEEYNADMVSFGISVVNDRNEVIEQVKTYNGIVEGNRRILDLHFKYLKHPSLCRLFRRNLFNKVELLDQNIGIDEMLILQLLAQCEKVVYTSRIYYFALARVNSVSRIQYSLKKISQGIKVHRFICDFIDENNNTYSAYSYIKYLKYLITVYDIARKDKRLFQSKEFFWLKKDLVRYYSMSKNSEVFKRESLIFKIKLHMYALHPILFTFLSSVIIFLNFFKIKSK